MENDILASQADLRTKINVIKNNTQIFSFVMCKVLNVPRSTYYYESKPKKDETQLVTDIIEIFVEAEIITGLEN